MTLKLFLCSRVPFSVPVPFEYCTYTLSIDAMTALEPHASLIKDLFETGKVYSEISTMLHRMVIQWCSEMRRLPDVRRFCAQHDLRRKRLVSDAEKRAVVGAIYSMRWVFISVFTFYMLSIIRMLLTNDYFLNRWVHLMVTSTWQAICLQSECVQENVVLERFIGRTMNSDVR